MYAREAWHDEHFQKWADAWIQNTDRTAAAADAEEVRIRETAGDPDPHDHAFAMKAIELIMQGKEHNELSELAFAEVPAVELLRACCRPKQPATPPRRSL
jgi:hypothetical protein